MPSKKELVSIWNMINSWNIFFQHPRKHINGLLHHLPCNTTFISTFGFITFATRLRLKHLWYLQYIFSPTFCFLQIAQITSYTSTLHSVSCIWNCIICIKFNYSISFLVCLIYWKRLYIVQQCGIFTTGISNLFMSVANF